tara:strand:+ start:1580 stop:2263 length:684 start_codon:yes stop_codon:yes gene_type:complete
MCGIFGSHNYDIYEKLYIANKIRGDYATGSVYYDKETGTHIKKSEAGESLTGERAFLHNNSDVPNNWYIGHRQAPTSAVRDYSEDTTHPFTTGDWTVAHNGVLENSEQLKYQYGITSDNPVDSSVIPELLAQFKSSHSLYAIGETCSKLKGTFGCWLYNHKTEDVYIVRSGSTIYANLSTRLSTAAFSSVKTKHTPDLVDEGVIYLMTKTGLKNIGKFTANSPFLLL